MSTSNWVRKLLLILAISTLYSCHTTREFKLYKDLDVVGYGSNKCSSSDWILVRDRVTSEIYIMDLDGNSTKKR